MQKNTVKTRKNAICDIQLRHAIHAMFKIFLPELPSLLIDKTCDTFCKSNTQKKEKKVFTSSHMYKCGDLLYSSKPKRINDFQFYFS